MPQTNLEMLVNYMKKETEQEKIQKQKEELKRQQKAQSASDNNRITNPNVLRKYGLTESVNPQMLME